MTRIAKGANGIGVLLLMQLDHLIFVGAIFAVLAAVCSLSPLS